jgi:hypothetical protein
VETTAVSVETEAEEYLGKGAQALARAAVVERAARDLRFRPPPGSAARADLGCTALRVAVAVAVEFTHLDPGVTAAGAETDQAQRQTPEAEVAARQLRLMLAAMADLEFAS